MIINPYLYKKIEGGTPDFKMNGIELIFDTATDIEIGMAGRNGDSVTYGTAYKWAIFLDGDYLKVEEGVTSETQIIIIPNNTAGLHRVTMLCMLDNQDYCARSIAFRGSNSVGSYNKLISAKGIGTGFEGTSVMADYCYYRMFNGCTNLTTAPELPATTLAIQCYRDMFNGCTNLTTAPELPATTLAIQCYNGMFNGCTNLTTAPELPAMTLAIQCYGSMFNGCTNLTTAPELPATTLVSNCYYLMFNGCTNLTTAPELPATTLVSNCYNGMFRGCTNLTTAPELPAMTLADYCYGSMFRGCTNLTTAPELPATTLVSNCYNSMFYSCTNLTTAPELPATTLAIQCYNGMFYSCTNLAEVKCYYTSNLSSTYADKWLQNAGSAVVSPSNKGKLYSPNAVITYGLPTNWENLAL